MSDDRVRAGAAGDGDDADDTRAVPVNRPQRPTGKRSRQGGVALAEPEEDREALTEEFEALDGDGKKKPVKKGGAPRSRNPFVFVLTYLKQVVAELRKVIWPSRKQMASYTSVVLVFLAFMTALIGLIDLGLAKLVMLVFG